MLRVLRAHFTLAFNRYNVTDDPEVKARCAHTMAKYLRNASLHGFNSEQISQGKSYPTEVEKYLLDPSLVADSDILTPSVERLVNKLIDSNEILRVGEGRGIVYAYGYACAPDRLKIGSTEADLVDRIAAQIFTSTPDKPSVKLEIRCDNCRSLERAIHAILDVRGKRVEGGGEEWFKTSPDEIRKIAEFIIEKEL